MVSVYQKTEMKTEVYDDYDTIKNHDRHHQRVKKNNKKQTKTQIVL